MQLEHQAYFSSSDLTGFVRRDRLTMVLRDGASKPAEVACMPRLLKPGDQLLAQDHAPSRDYFAANINGVRCSPVNDRQRSISSQSDCA